MIETGAIERPREPAPRHEGEGRKRRRRGGGRDRSEARETQGSPAIGQPISPSASDGGDTVIPQAMAVGELPAAVESQPAAMPEATAVSIEARDQVRPAFATVTEVSADTGSAVEPPRPAAAAPVMSAAIAPIALPADLTLIETNPDKLPVLADKAEQTPPRPPRVRPSLPPISEEPLIQVDTQK